MTRLTITFDEAEVEALREAAAKAMRPTKDHARFLLRSVLFHEQPQEQKPCQPQGEEVQSVQAV